MSDTLRAIMPETYKSACIHKLTRGCALIPSIDDSYTLDIWHNFVVPKLYAGKVSFVSLTHPPIAEMETIIRSVAEDKLSSIKAKDLVEWCKIYMPDFIHIYYPGLKSPCIGCTHGEYRTELNPSPGEASMQHYADTPDKDLYTMATTGNDVDGGQRFVHGNGRIYQRHIRTRNIDPLDQPDYILRERQPLDAPPTPEQEAKVRAIIQEQPRIIIEQMLRSHNNRVVEVARELQVCLDSQTEEGNAFVYEYLKGIDPLNLDFLPDELATFVNFDERYASVSKNGEYKMLTTRFVLTTTSSVDTDNEYGFNDDDLDEDIIGGEDIPQEDFDEMMDKLDEERKEMSMWGVRVYYQLIQDLNTPEGRYFDQFDPLFGDIKLYRLDDQSGQTLWTTVKEEMRKMVMEMEADNVSYQRIEQALEEFTMPFEILSRWNPLIFKQPKPLPSCPNCGESENFDVIDGIITCPRCVIDIRTLSVDEAEAVYLPHITAQVQAKIPIIQTLSSLPERIINILMAVVTDQGVPIRYLPSHVKAFLLEADKIMGGKVFNSKKGDKTIRNIYHLYSMMMSQALQHYKILWKLAVSRDPRLNDLQEEIRNVMMAVYKGEARVATLLQLRSAIFTMAKDETVDPIIQMVLAEVWTWHEQACYCPIHGWRIARGVQGWSTTIECRHTHILSNLEILKSRMDTSKLSVDELKTLLDGIDDEFSMDVSETSNDGTQQLIHHGKAKPFHVCHEPVIRVYKEIWKNFNSTQKTVMYSPTPEELLAKAM